MPGFYPPGEYDLAGFIVGVVERKKTLERQESPARRHPDRAAVRRPAHQRLFRSARKLIFEAAKLKPDAYVAEVGNKIGAETAEAAFVLRAPALKNILARGWVSALAHITGGGHPG